MNSCELVKNHTYFTKWLIRTNVYELARTNSCDLWKITRILRSGKFVQINTNSLEWIHTNLLKITRILRSGKFVQMYTNSLVRINAICKKSHVFYEVANSYKCMRTRSYKFMRFVKNHTYFMKLLIRRYLYEGLWPNPVPKFNHCRNRKKWQK